MPTVENAAERKAVAVDTTTAAHPYAHFVHLVSKPARYIGGEYQSVVKPWESVDCRFALGFPDVYDIGMSHMGTKILYSLVNKADDLLMERVFCPWVDMQDELRKRDLPLLSLENHRPLCDFDVVGFSLQYEMTYTNVLTMLDLGGIPRRNADRTLDDPLIIAGGPSVTHPEPITPFVDAFLVGDAEERLPRLLRHYAELKTSGLSRLEILAELAKEGGVYCPDLYETEVCERSGLEVVSKPKLDGVPEVVERAFLDDISRYRFPDDSPVAVAEAIFDRMSVEIARGCTEGCRFCQAGMIYRPVRERDPEEVIETVLSAIEKGGYDEASITSLSTADYSCVSPLIKELMAELRERKVSLGISSLRAYGLSDELLTEISTVKATGLTFAPEAGTQRMRDVINKNITEADIFETCHRVFSKGWNRMKLYFILGLPTETDEDVVGIAEMGRQAREIAMEYKHNPKVTVSVSSHVPKPHTPFQWCAMDTMEEIVRKQDILWRLTKAYKLTFRRHEMQISHLEGIVARGDRRVGWLIERAYDLGARFDGWDEHLNWEAWQQALDEFEERYGVERRLYLDTLPVDGRLPWDHIDVGLEDGFLLTEYRKSLKDRLSPPCGKPVGAKVHHTNLEDAHAEEGRLVCYNCGIACDLTQMKTERIDFLSKLGAEKPTVHAGRKSVHDNALERVKQGLAPHDFDQGKKRRYRLRYTKLGPMRLQGHLDIVRVPPRIFRRAGLDPYYTEGYSPKPIMSFGNALGLGAHSLAEYADVTLIDDLSADELLERLNDVAPPGMTFTGVRKLGNQARALSKVVDELEWLVDVPAYADPDERDALQARCEELLADKERTVEVMRKNKRRVLRLTDIVSSAWAEPASALAAATGIEPGSTVLRFRTNAHGASLKPHEVAQAFAGSDDCASIVVRTASFNTTRGEADDRLRADLDDPAEVALVEIDTTIEHHRLIPSEVPDLHAIAAR